MSKRSQRDIDISTNASEPGLGWRGNINLWFTVFGMVMLIFTLNSALDLPTWWTLPAIALVLVLAFVGWLGWLVLIKRGVFTWMRAARQPARWMALGDAKAAETAFAKALARARRFAPDDHRRALMLCELAMYSKHQGRSAEALALYEESVDILAHHAAAEPRDYFVALNNYGICFIFLKDFEAAQRILEKAIDLNLAVRKREANTPVRMPLGQVQTLQLVLHLNLAVLLIEMREFGEAELQLREADTLAPILSKQALANWHDHYVGICALWEIESGNLEAAERELGKAKNSCWPSCLRVSARLCLAAQEFADAEHWLRVYKQQERQKGTLHRPELVKVTLEFGESLFGQGKHDDAFAALKEARSIVADFAIPADAAWREALSRWLVRARELGKGEIVASLEAELRKAPPAVQAVTILEKFRVQPLNPG